MKLPAKAGFRPIADIPIAVIPAKAGIPHLFCKQRGMRGRRTNIMANRPRGVLYIGVTAELPARIWQHRNGEGSDFCRRYKLTRLVHVEQHDCIDDAIAREKAMMAWKRAWKIELIESANPQSLDLWEQINA